jgi:DNA-binding NarL/FixJ family response regulator
VAYVSKDQPPSEIVKLANDILDGKKIQSPTMTRPVLSDRELQILTRLGRGMKRTEIAAELGINEKTVSTYQSRLLQKLGLRNVVDLLRYAVEEALVD